MSVDIALPIPLPRPKPLSVDVALPIPLPRPKPERPAEAGSPEEPPPASRRPGDRGQWALAEIEAARAECRRLLSMRAVAWIAEAPLGDPGTCGTPAPVSISEVAGIRIDPPATFNCAMAAAVHDWLANSVQPAARRELGTPITALSNASSYTCRHRNNGGSGKMSEHATANALDIAGFVFGTQAQVSVTGDWSGLLASIGLSKRGNFLRAVRQGSCDYFNTVLGPGSDSFHRDHFHVDMMQLRPGRGKMCR